MSSLQQDLQPWPGAAGIVMAQDVLDRLMPMHLLVAPTGHIRHAGPTLRRIAPAPGPEQQRLLEYCEFRRPAGLQSIAGLRAAHGRTATLRFTGQDMPLMRGLILALAPEEGILINLALGYHLREAVREFDLKLTDFAATDPSIDMLYLMEAKAAILDESRRLNTRLEQARRAAEEQAVTDTLTGLPNRRALDRLLHDLARYDPPEGFGLMHVDLDYFKDVNDTHGHAAGDHVLGHVARILREETRAGDLVARVGGDEFVIVLRRCDDLRLIEDVALRIIARLEAPIGYEGHICRVSASIGTAISTHYAKVKPDRLLSDADRALYASKHSGRGQHTLFHPGLRKTDLRLRARPRAGA